MNIDYTTWTWAVVGICAEASNLKGPDARAWCEQRRDALRTRYDAGDGPFEAYNAVCGEDA